MKIEDLVYGSEEVNEKELIELINSKPVQRLRKISQFGMPEEYSHKKSFSRYEHSLGVMILLKRLGAGLEEQFVGLLHDVSHTAFSHVADSVYVDFLEENYHDRILPKIIEKTEIKDILDRQGLDYKKIINLEKFSLLERPAPDLCADRVDYALREIAFLHNKKDAQEIFENLINFNGKIVFNAIRPAELFSNYYIRLNRNHWAENGARARSYLLAESIRRAINIEIISADDLMLTDEEVLNILNKSSDEKIIRGLKMLKNGFLLNKSSNGNGIVLTKKFRYVDPEILLHDGIVRLSKISNGYKNALNQEKLLHQNKQSFQILPLK